jgi:uncharacterized membrane protein
MRISSQGAVRQAPLARTLVASSKQWNRAMSHAFTPAILIHLAAALLALVLGGAIFLRGKGNSAHRLLGRTWVALMLVTALSTWWIRGNGSFSWIHGLSVLTLVLLGVGVYYAMQSRIAAHQRTMKGLYAGALVVAGAFALLPQRLLGQMLWSALGLA